MDAPTLFALIVSLAVLGSVWYLAATTAKRLVTPWRDPVGKQ
ncbi:hypothetical protein [Plantactinospora sp. DSM 117369]